jgi:hypothetical protein
MEQEKRKNWQAVRKKPPCGRRVLRENVISAKAEIQVRL